MILYFNDYINRSLFNNGQDCLMHSFQINVNELVTEPNISRKGRNI